MRIALLLVILAACPSGNSKAQRQACKDACMADVDGVLAACGPLASEDQTAHMTSRDLQDQLARAQCQTQVLESAVGCAHACDR